MRIAIYDGVFGIRIGMYLRSNRFVVKRGGS
jgi:hypothetical protein